MINDKPAEPFNWRPIHSVVVLLVLSFFLYTVQGILNPFILFVLLVFLMSPYSGTRHHLLLVSATAMLTLIWALNTTGFLLAPFVLAVVLAYVQHPLVTRLEKRMSRTWATVLLMLPAVGVLALVIFLGIPAVSAQIGDFIHGAPKLIQTATERLQAWQTQLASRDLPMVDEQSLITRLQSLQPEAVMGWLQQRQAAIGRAAWGGIMGVGRGLSAVLTILGYVFLTPILTFYLLRDWPLVMGRIHDLVPPSHRDRVTGFASEFDKLLSGYMRGQLIESSIVGVLTWLGFVLLGFPYALLLAVIAAVFNVIPYLGLVLTAVPALVIALFLDNPLWAIGKVAIVFLIVQILDGSILGPKIVGDSVGIHPVWVILALSLFGFFFGFVGLLLAIPLAVLVKLMVQHGMTRYRSSKLFRGERPLIALD